MFVLILLVVDKYQTFMFALVFVFVFMFVLVLLVVDNCQTLLSLFLSLCLSLSS